MKSRTCNPSSHRSLTFTMAALTVGGLLSAPVPARALIGERLETIRNHSLFHRFGMEYTGRRALLTDSYVATFQPQAGSRARGIVTLDVTVGPGEQVLEMELRMARGFVNGPDAAHARDIVRALLQEGMPPDDYAKLQPLVAELERAGSATSARMPQADAVADAAVSARSATIDDLDQRHAWLGLTGMREITKIPLANCRVILENVQRTGGKHLLVTVGFQPKLAEFRVKGALYPGRPILPMHTSMAAGPAQQAGLPSVAPPFAGQEAPEEFGDFLPSVAPERRAYLESWLDAADLGQAMSHAEDERLHGAEPADAAYSRLGGLYAGNSMWMGINKAPVWRLNELHWVFPSDAAAAAYLAERAPAMSRGLPAQAHLSTAGVGGQVFAGLQDGFFPGIRSAQEVHVFRVGRVVVALHAVEGPDTQALRPAYVRDIAGKIAARVLTSMPGVRGPAASQSGAQMAR